MDETASKGSPLSVTYSRLFNLGNYENEKLEVTWMVEGDDVAAAFAAARTAVETQHEYFQSEREEAAERAQAQREAEWARQREEAARKREEERAAYRAIQPATVPDASDDDDDFDEDDSSEDDNSEDDDI